MIELPDEIVLRIIEFLTFTDWTIILRISKQFCYVLQNIHLPYIRQHNHVKMVHMMAEGNVNGIRLLLNKDINLNHYISYAIIFKQVECVRQFLNQLTVNTKMLIDASNPKILELLLSVYSKQLTKKHCKIFETTIRKNSFTLFKLLWTYVKTSDMRRSISKYCIKVLTYTDRIPFLQLLFEIYPTLGLNMQCTYYAIQTNKVRFLSIILTFSTLHIYNMEDDVVKIIKTNSFNDLKELFIKHDLLNAQVFKNKKIKT